MTCLPAARNAAKRSPIAMARLGVRPPSSSKFSTSRVIRSSSAARSMLSMRSLTAIKPESAVSKITSAQSRGGVISSTRVPEGAMNNALSCSIVGISGWLNSAPSRTIKNSTKAVFKAKFLALVSLRPQREKKPSWFAASLIFASKINLEVSLATHPSYAYEFSTLTLCHAVAVYTFMIFCDACIDRRLG